MKRWRLMGVVCLALLAGVTGCELKDSAPAPSGPVPEASSSAATRLESALKEFGSNTAEFQQFLDNGDPTWVRKVLRDSQEERTGYAEMHALRQITAYMAEQDALPERFLTVCMGTDLLVISSDEYVYSYDQWHTAVCARGSVPAEAKPPTP